VRLAAAPSAPTLDVLHDVLDSVASAAWLEDRAAMAMAPYAANQLDDELDEAPAAPAAAHGAQAAARLEAVAAPSAPAVAAPTLDLAAMDFDDP